MTLITPTLAPHTLVKTETVLKNVPAVNAVDAARVYLLRAI